LRIETLLCLFDLARLSFKMSLIRLTIAVETVAAVAATDSASAAFGALTMKLDAWTRIGFATVDRITTTWSEFANAFTAATA
jgi:hypothetical protein